MSKNSGSHENAFLSHNRDIIDQFIKGLNLLNEKNKLNSYQFNYLKFFGISETMHSFLIANLLNPNAEHGQGDYFLEIFLLQIGIENNETQKWIVTAEKGKIDILIKGCNPHSVIIIENKSNDACDQPHQLYRYWYNHMFLPYEHKDHQYALIQKQKFRLIYLTRANDKSPNENTLTKPEGYDNESLPPSLKMKDITFLTFQKDIVEWLKKCLPTLEQKENYRLSEYIKQYIDYWQS